MRLLSTLICFILVSSFLCAQENYSKLEGEFQIQPGFNIVISTDGEDLYVKPTKKPKEKLINIEDGIFKIESINGTLDFSLLEEKDVVVVHMYGTVIHAPKFPYEDEGELIEEIELSSYELKRFVGSYQVTKTKSLTITIEEGYLKAQISGEPVFPIFPYAINKFFYDVAPVKLEFVMDDDGDVNYLLLKQANRILQAKKI
jgi:hypothetical protein